LWAKVSSGLEIVNASYEKGIRCTRLELHYPTSGGRPGTLLITKMSSLSFNFLQQQATIEYDDAVAPK
jgi:hypothetical protein